MTYNNFLRRLTIAALLGLAVFLASGVAANATPIHELTTPSGTYVPYKVVGSGPTAHYNTPDVNPSTANSERHVWSGNGSEHLPCPAGIHWIDNANVLTISHCLEAPPETTTTTTPPETTTTTEPTTTTTEPPTTTTQPPETTTTTAPICGEEECPPDCSSTCEPPSTTQPPTPTTTIPEVSTDIPELPYTGPGEVLAVMALVGLALSVLGGLAVRASRIR